MRYALLYALTSWALQPVLDSDSVRSSRPIAPRGGKGGAPRVLMNVGDEKRECSTMPPGRSVSILTLIGCCGERRRDSRDTSRARRLSTAAARAPLMPCCSMYSLRNTPMVSRSGGRSSSTSTAARLATSVVSGRTTIRDTSVRTVPISHATASLRASSRPSTVDDGMFKAAASMFSSMRSMERIEAVWAEPSNAVEQVRSRDMRHFCSTYGMVLGT
mmetsp:Transcript_8678/g.21353  ORF Transcript_8678/g.21353 Transcript_8678/m.21353 type:complete len:217 (+) Transcript_8678:993-1643(+)